MESVSKTKSHLQPLTMAELLPGLSGILSKDAIQTLTAKKQPRKTIALTRTSEKNVKPLTIAEMKAEILALKVPSPRKCIQPTTSVKKKPWVTSVKVDNKTKSHTANGQLKNNSVRKVLQFQPKPVPKAVQTPRIAAKLETPKFPKPEVKSKKALYGPAKSSVNISGIYDMPETPSIINKPNKNRMTLANKENYAQYARKTNVIHKASTPVQKKFITPVPDTPLTNMSWKSENDASFLQREKEVHDIEEKSKGLAEEPTLENIAEVSPPVSTPFKDYRNVQEFFNHTNDTENSGLFNDNTIMSFEKITQCKENSKREESVIVTLCDLFNKAAVANVEEPKTDLNDLLEVKKQLEHNIKMVENGIQMLTNIKESHIKSLHSLVKVIKEKRAQKQMNNDNNNTLIKTDIVPTPEQEVKLNEISPVSSKPCSVIKSKSPSYKIPKKTPCLRKKILYKSMPNVSEGYTTPNKDMDKRAFNMYMKMKMHEMNFLNTPCVKHHKTEVPDTALTSHNLQMQLNKIFKDDI